MAGSTSIFDFHQPEYLVSGALGAFTQDIVLPRLVNRTFDQHFARKIGTTVDVLIPGGPVLARDFQLRTPKQTDNKSGALGRPAGSGEADAVPAGGDSTIKFSDLDESTAPVTLDRHLYNAVRLTDEDITLHPDRFIGSILSRQVEGLARGAEDVLATVMNGIAVDALYDVTKPLESILAAQQAMDARLVPRGGRQLAIAPDLVPSLVLNEALLRVDASGTSDALREARVGRLMGVDVVVSPYLDAGTALLFTKDAFTFVTRVPVAPKSGPATASESFQGIGMRWIGDYDSTTLADRSIVSLFCGAQVLRSDSYVKLDVDGPAGS